MDHELYKNSIQNLGNIQRFSCFDRLFSRVYSPEEFRCMSCQSPCQIQVSYHNLSSKKVHFLLWCNNRTCMWYHWVRSAIARTLVRIKADRMDNPCIDCTQYRIFLYISLYTKQYHPSSLHPFHSGHWLLYYMPYLVVWEYSLKIRWLNNLPPHWLYILGALFHPYLLNLYFFPYNSWSSQSHFLFHYVGDQ